MSRWSASKKTRGSSLELHLKYGLPMTCHNDNPLDDAGMRETLDREVKLEDCHPDILEAVLQFCYMGECRRPKKDMLGLLIMADRLDIPCLTAICEKVSHWTMKPAVLWLAASCCHVPPQCRGKAIGSSAAKIRGAHIHTSAEFAANMLPDEELPE